MVRLDSNFLTGDNSEQLRTIEEKLNEMRSQYEQVNTKKEWAEARLKEMEL